MVEVQVEMAGLKLGEGQEDRKVKKVYRSL